jgi:hypothetical protein
LSLWSPPYTNSLCSTFQISCPMSSLRSFIQRIRPGPRLIDPFRNEFVFYGEGLLAPRPTPKLEAHPLSFVRGYLFNIFAANLQCWRPSLPSAIRGRPMLWWQGDPLVKLTRLLTMQYLPASYYFFTLRPKYSPHKYPRSLKIIDHVQHHMKLEEDIDLYIFYTDRLCGLVVTVLDSRSRGPGFDSRR